MLNPGKRSGEGSGKGSRSSGKAETVRKPLQKQLPNKKKILDVRRKGSNEKKDARKIG